MFPLPWLNRVSRPKEKTTWTAFQEGDEAQRQALIAAARHSGEARTGAKKRRRRKKKPNGQGQPMDDGE